MNILFYTCFDVAPQKGGTERITSTIATGLRKKGIKCFLAYDADIDSTLEKTVFDGKIKIGSFKKQSNIQRLSEFVFTNHIDIIVIQGLFDKTACIKKNISNVRIVFVHHFNPGAEETFLSYHSIISHIKRRNGERIKNYIKFLLYPVLKIRYILKLHKTYKTTYQVADKVVLLSKGFINDFTQYAHIKDMTKFYIIHNALSFNTFYDMSQYVYKQEDVIIVSRLEEKQKRISLALQIWELIENNPISKNWTLRIIGTGSDIDKYKKIVAKKQLKHIVFEGRQNPEPYYQKASIFMMTSSFEGWGLTLTEAQQYGVVPLAFNSYASVSDIITDKYNGYLVSNNDINSYVKYLTLLMSDYDLRHRMALNCIESSKRFERQHICNQWIQLFKQLM